MGYLFWNKKCASLRISDLSVGILGGDSLWKRVARFLLDGAIVFGYFAAMMTTVGIGTPVVGELASHLLGIPNTFELKLGVILVFCLFFTLSASNVPGTLPDEELPPRIVETVPPVTSI